MGLGRSGTGSSRAAPEQLGYAFPYQGWHTVEDRAGDSVLWWCRLLQRGNLSPVGDCVISAVEFDQILGESRSVREILDLGELLC